MSLRTPSVPIISGLIQASRKALVIIYSCDYLGFKPLRLDLVKTQLAKKLF